MNDLKRSLRGRVGTPDRVQRLVIGLILMGLNVAGLMLHRQLATPQLVETNILQRLADQMRASLGADGS